jgi:hypothetical protein
MSEPTAVTYCAPNIMKIIRIKNRVIRLGMENAWDECENFTVFVRGR